DIDVPALLGNDVKHGYAAKLVSLSHDPKVAAGDITHAAAIDGERALGGVELGESRGNFLADDQLGGFAFALGGPGLGGGGRNLALFLFPHRQHDRPPPAYIVEGVLNGAGPAAVCQPVQ